MNSILQEVLWQDVDSSNIAQIAFHQDEGKILVKFHSGVIWAYADCDSQLFDQFESADSVGKFFLANIKTKAGEKLN